MKIFITAIGTDCGKTLASAIVTEALKADYWKPIQAGLPRDADTVRSLISNPLSKIHPEAYLLKTPESPHAAAKKEGINISLGDLKLPTTSNNLVIEGAGGMLVPINQRNYVIDIASVYNLNIILVANIYLGSINHTLLTVEELKRRQLNVLGIIFNGENPDSEKIILEKSKYPLLLKIQREHEITPEIVLKYAAAFRKDLLKIEHKPW